VAKLGEMGGYVDSATACYGSSVGLNPDISQNLKVSKGAANTLKPTRKIYTKKKNYSNPKNAFCQKMIFTGK
jgi:hypothetical protein